MGQRPRTSTFPARRGLRRWLWVAVVLPIGLVAGLVAPGAAAPGPAVPAHVSAGDFGRTPSAQLETCALGWAYNIFGAPGVTFNPRITTGAGVLAFDAHGPAFVAFDREIGRLQRVWPSGKRPSRTSPEFRSAVHRCQSWIAAAVTYWNR